MLEQLIREKITEAVKARDNFARDLLRTALGEIQRNTLQTDEDQMNVIKKMVKNIDITLNLIKDRPADASVDLQKEKVLLSTLLPQTMSKDEIIQFIKDNNIVIDPLQEGRSIGLVMKSLKAQDKKAEPALVKDIISQKLYII